MSMAHAAQELQQQQQQQRRSYEQQQRRSYEQQIPQQLQQPQQIQQPQQQQQQVHSRKVDVEDLNIITEEIPDWLRLYSEASSQSDHLLNWNLFKLPQLQKYDEMLMKLFKQEAINIVIKYERPRREINWELARRQSFH
ncbi:WW domain-containing protein [Aphelenchoides avenae]|nr:WW domain-containing protein [Aphelenchus avenae]